MIIRYIKIQIFYNFKSFVDTRTLYTTTYRYLWTNFLPKIYWVKMQLLFLCDGRHEFKFLLDYPYCCPLDSSMWENQVLVEVMLSRCRSGIHTKRLFSKTWWSINKASWKSERLLFHEEAKKSICSIAPGEKSVYKAFLLLEDCYSSFKFFYFNKSRRMFV